METVQARPVRPDAGRFGDSLIEAGVIGAIDLTKGGYDFTDVLDIVAHHLVDAGQDRAVMRMLASRTMTVRQFLRERYGVSVGTGDDARDLRRFRLWLADARWRLRRSKASSRVNRWMMGHRC